eukprot:XP_011681757.1 PREDICTED: uncharacterized protein LOC105446511 [Strongylocentrotus purpuratus]
MGVGQSRIGPKIPESDDISFKSCEEKPSHKKKPGLMRFIVDAILGEVSPSPEELGFARFSESPESGADFEIEEAFVDAPLPAARHGKEAKSERKVTPGRARAKRRSVTSKSSKYNTNQSVHFIDKLSSSSSSSSQGEVQKKNSVKDETDATRLDATPASKVSDEGIEMHVPSSHGRGDSATSEPKDPKVGNRCPNQDIEAPTTLSLVKPCSSQKNYHDYNSENIPLADTQGTTARSIIQKILKLSAVGSDKLNHEKGGGEAKLNAGKDPYTLAVKEKGGLNDAENGLTDGENEDTHATTALSTIKKILKLSAVGSDKLNREKDGGEAKLNAGKDPNTLAVKENGGLTCANIKSERPLISMPTTTNTASTTDSQKPLPILKEAQGIQDDKTKTKSKLEKKRVDMFTVEKRATLTKEEAPDLISFQSNNKVQISSSGRHRTTALSTIQKMIELTAVGSDRVTNVKDREEAKLKVGKDATTLAVKDEPTRGLTASDNKSSNIKSNRPVVSNGELQDAPTVSPSTNNKKHFTIFKRPQGIPRRNPRNLLEKKRVDMLTGEKTKDPTSIGEASYMRTAGSKQPTRKGKALQKRTTRIFAPSLPPFTATAHQDIIYPHRVMMKTVTAESKVGPLDAVIKRPGQPVINSKPVTPRVSQEGKSLCDPDSKVDNVGKKEIQEVLQKTKVQKARMVVQKETRSVAELEEKLEEARKELDKIEKCMYSGSNLDKRTKVTNVANNQVQVGTVKEKPLTLATLKATKGDKSEGKVKEKPLLCPVFDNAVPRSAVFKGKKVGTASTSDRNPVQHNESKGVLKSPSIDGVKRTDGALCKGQGPVFTRLRSRKVSRRKLSANLFNMPSGSDKLQRPLPTKTSEDLVPSFDADAITVTNRGAPKREAEQVKRRSRTLSKVHSRSDVTLTKVDKETTGDSKPPLTQQVKALTCRGSGAKHKGTVTTKNALVSEQSRKLVDIHVTKQRLGLIKYSKHPLETTVLSEAFADIPTQSLDVMWMNTLTSDFFNNFLNLLADFPPLFQQSPRKSFEITVTSNIRGWNVTWISDRKFERMFQETLVCFEWQRPAMLFNSNFYPRRPCLPYFDLIGSNIAWTGECYHVQEVQYFPVFVRAQEADCGTKGVSLTGVETNSEEHAKEQPEENDECIKLVETADVQPNHVPYRRSDVAETVQTESCKTTCQPINHDSENANVQVSHTSDQSSDVVNTLQTDRPKPASQVTRLESVRQLREDGSNHKIATEVKVESGSKGMKKMEKAIDLQENHASSVDAKTKVPNEARGSVSKSIGETGKGGASQVKDEPSRKKDIKVNLRAVAAGNTKTYTKTKLGRGPRIVGDMRRIVHCNRNRRTDTPTTQLKIKFCLGCGDTKQPNGEPLIRCATYCDQAFFCCTKCQRETRNEHRETCKGVKRNYCRHTCN